MSSPSISFLGTSFTVAPQVSVFIPVVLTTVAYLTCKKVLEVATRHFKALQTIGVIFPLISLVVGVGVGNAVTQTAMVSFLLADPVVMSIALAIARVVTLIFYVKEVAVLMSRILGNSQAPSLPSALLPVDKTYLTELTSTTASQTPSLSGRDAEIQQILGVIGRDPDMECRHVIFQAEPDSCPDLIVKELVRRISTSELPAGSLFLGAKVYRFNLARLDYAKDIDTAIMSACQSGRTILVVEDLHTMVGKASYVQEIFISRMKEKSLTVIGILPKDKFDSFIQEASAMDPYFQSVVVAPMKAQDVFHSLQLQTKPGITLTPPALVLATLLSYNYVSKAFNLKDAQVLVSDITVKVQGQMGHLNPQPVEISQAMFMEKWKEVYPGCRHRVRLENIDPQTRDFFAEQIEDFAAISRAVKECTAVLDATAPRYKKKTPNCLTDMVEEARRGKFASSIGHEKAIDFIVTNFCGVSQRSTLLIGPPGIGKSLIPETLAYMVAKNDPRVARLGPGIMVYRLDVVRLTAYTYAGEKQQAIKELEDFCEERRGRLIVVADEVDQMKGAGVHHLHPESIADSIKASMARDEIVLVGMANDYQWLPVATKDPAFADRFKEYPVKPPTQAQCLQMMCHVNNRGGYTSNAPNMVLSKEAIAAAIVLTGLYKLNRCYPRKAVGLISELVAHYTMYPKPQTGIDSRVLIISEDVITYVYQNLGWGKDSHSQDQQIRAIGQMVEPLCKQVTDDVDFKAST